VARLDTVTLMMLRIRCGEQGRNPVQLLADWYAGGRTPLFPAAQSRSVEFTHSGREAIALAMRRWNIGNGDEVLVPAYNCGAEISPIIATRARVLMYRNDAAGNIDVEDLSRRLSGRTRVICVTHYFGRPSDLREITAICRERNVKLLEDCALSLFSGDVGRRGDAAIFSLRKSLPATDGGVLVIDGEMATVGPSESSLSAVAPAALSLSKKWIRHWLWIGAGRKGNIGVDDWALQDIPASYYSSADAPILGASRLALGVLNRTNWSEVVKRRRRNYTLLKKLVDGAPRLTFFWSEEQLGSDVCPLGLPVVVENKAEWCRRLNGAGVDVSPWWAGFHRALDWTPFPEARMLKEHLILLPVHQGLTIRDMEYIASVVNLLARG
jgi:perosamine synthetase